MASSGLMDKSFVSSNDELFYLKWNNFQKNVSTQFEKLREEDDLVDITFACEGRKLTAHKLVLFACSPFFKELLKKNPSPHPVFFMNDVKYDVLKAILEYMYLGEVHITNENLKDFIKTAEGLQIRGLSKENNTDLSMPPAAATPQSSVSHMTPIGRKVIIDDKETIVTAENVQLLDELCRKRPVDQGTGDLTSGGGQVVGLNIKRLKTATVVETQIQSDGSGSHVEPKVEMVEYLDAETTNHQSPTYCSMDNFTEKNNSRNNMTHMGQINAATFTQTPTQASSSGHQQQQQQQQQQQHVQHEYKSEEDSSWMDKSLDNISVNSEHQQQQQQQPGQQNVKYKAKSSSSGSGGGGGGSSSRSQRSSEDKTNCLTPRCCPVCSRLYSNVSNLRQHMRLIHNPTAVCCPICQKHFNSELYLKRHYSSIHSINAGGTGTGDGGELVDQKPPAQLANQQQQQQGQTPQQQQQGQQQQQQQATTQQQQQQQQQQTPATASTNTWNPYHHHTVGDTQLVNPFIK